ncbi:MAG: UxaA family hydrolase [Ruthenibacterium lactatiformans]
MGAHPQCAHEPVRRGGVHLCAGRASPVPVPPETFQGYRREDGRVGVRNELWIIPPSAA